MIATSPGGVPDRFIGAWRLGSKSQVRTGRFAEHKQSLDQIALAWLFAQKPWIVPIQGTTKGIASSKRTSERPESN